MCAFLTPFSRQSIAPVNLGYIPPLTFFLSLNTFLASLKLIVDIFFPFRSFTPETSVKRIIFSAFKDDATEHAAKSALIFIGILFLVQPIGEITGIFPNFMDLIILFLLMTFIKPTSPRFLLLSLIATIGEFFFPTNLLVFPPHKFIKSEISLFILLSRTFWIMPIISFLVFLTPLSNSKEILFFFNS